MEKKNLLRLTGLLWKGISDTEPCFRTTVPKTMLPNSGNAILRDLCYMAKQDQKSCKFLKISDAAFWGSGGANETLSVLERHEEIVLDYETREKLLKISSPTIRQTARY